MRRPVAVILLFIVCRTLGAQTPFQCRGQYYMTQQLDRLDPTRTFFTSSIYALTIDLGGDDIQFNLIDGTENTFWMNAMGYRITDNLIYLVEQFNRNLVQVDATGTLRVLRQLNELPSSKRFQSGACTPDGRFLVVSGNPVETRLVPGAGAVDFVQPNDALYFIDLTDPDYPVTSVEMNGNEFTFADMAFDPFTGICYAYDQLDEQLISIDMRTGATTPIGEGGRLVGVMGSLFFDSFGNLYGYGNPIETVEVVDFSEDGQNTLFAINKSTGEMTKLIKDQVVGGTDGCACPYTLDVLKSVSPQVTVPCTDVVYTFAFSNASAIGRSGLIFSDTLPSGLTFSEVLQNPFQGNLSISDDGRIMTIEDMIIPLGTDSLKVRVAVGNVMGTVSNQAYLVGLPDSLNAFLPSDDPSTLNLDDPTILTVRELDFDLDIINEMVCAGDTLVLEVDNFDAEYLWSDGSTGSSLSVTEPGFYSLMAWTECDTFFNEIEAVFHDPFETSIIPSGTRVALGDSVRLQGEASGDGTYSYRWIVNPSGGLEYCMDCSEIVLQPFETTLLELRIRDEVTGCTDTEGLRLIVDRNLNIWVPNVFTPNGDDINDLFYVLGQFPYRIATFAIYNRWGQRVFLNENIAVNDAAAGWSGMFNGTLLDPGVFVWKAIFQFPDGTSVVRAGDVTLMR